MTVLNLAKLPITTIDLSPGSHLLIHDVTWDQYEALLATWQEERRIPRMNYCNGVLELMSPLPAHERPHRIIADIVKAILDAQERPWEDFGSTTFKQPKRAGLEPDSCFYIQNAERVRALMRIDMEKDPPPDLAIEADVTSKTTLEAYATLQVPEVWIYDNGNLTIYLLICFKIMTINPHPTAWYSLTYRLRSGYPNGCNKRLNWAPAPCCEICGVVSHEGRKTEMAMTIWQATQPPFPVDLIVRSPEELLWRYQEYDPLIRTAIDRGRVLYGPGRVHCGQGEGWLQPGWAWGRECTLRLGGNATHGALVV